MERLKYSNILNMEYTLSTTSNSLNVFMVLCYKAYNKRNEAIIIDFDYLKNLLNINRQSEEKLIQSIERLKKDLLKCVIKINPVAIKNMNEGITDNKAKPYYVDITLFPVIVTDLEKRELRTRVCTLSEDLFENHPEYKLICEEYILSFFNELKEYTLIDLQEYIRLKSRYSKNLYRILKQFNSTGWRELSLEELRRLLNCGDGYNNKEFMRTCLYPAIKELEETECFKDLKMEIKKDDHKRGKPIKSIKFTFMPEKYKKPESEQLVDGSNENKEESKQTHVKPNPKIKFNNFKQREYDYEDLERRLQHQQSQQ